MSAPEARETARANGWGCLGAVLLAVAPWFALLLSTLAPDHGWVTVLIVLGLVALVVLAAGTGLAAAAGDPMRRWLEAMNPGIRGLSDAQLASIAEGVGHRVRAVYSHL